MSYSEFLNVVCRYKQGLGSVQWPSVARAVEQSEEEDPTKVVSLDLCGNELQTLEGLEDYSLLISLSLAQNQLLSLDTARLPFTLTHLDLSCNDLSSLDGLNGLPHLMWLDCSHNRIDSLRPLSQCYRLRYLMASHNEISTVVGIEGLQKLERLQLNSNHISSLSEVRVIATMKNLKHLALRSNPIARSNNFRLQLTHMMPGLYYLDREPLRSGPVHNRAEAKQPTEKEKNDSLHEEMVRMPFFNPPGTLDMDGNRLEDCEESADVDMAPEDATRWLRYVFRDIAKNFGMTLEEIRDADFGEGSRGPGTLPMAKKVQALVDVQMLQLRMNKEQREQDRPEGVVEPQYMSPRKAPTVGLRETVPTPGPRSPAPTTATPSKSVNLSSTGGAAAPASATKRYKLIKTEDPFRQSWSPGAGARPPNPRAMESNARHVDRIRIGRMMQEELDTPLSPGQVRSVVLPSLNFVNSLNGPLSPEAFYSASRVSYGRPQSAVKVIERSKKRVDDRWESPPPGFEIRDRYLTPSPGRTRTVSSYEDFKQRMSFSMSLNLEEKKGRSLAGYQGWTGKGKDAPKPEIRPPTDRDAEAYATHRDRVRIGKVITDEEKSGRPLAGWHFTPSVDLSKPEERERLRSTSPFWNGSQGPVSNFSTSIHERAMKRMSTELSSTQLGQAISGRATPVRGRSKSVTPPPPDRSQFANTAPPARSPVASRSPAPARRAENPNPKHATFGGPHASSYGHEDPRHDIRALSTPTSKGATTPPRSASPSQNTPSPLGRFVIKQQEGTARPRAAPATPAATAPAPESHLETPPKTVAHAHNSGLQKSEQSSGAYSPGALASPYNSYRIDQHGVAPAPPAPVNAAPEADESVVTNQERSVSFADGVDPPSPVPHTTVPTKPEPVDDSRSFTQLLNDSELEYIMEKAAMAEPPVPAPAPGAYQPEHAPLTEVGASNQYTVSPRVDSTVMPAPVSPRSLAGSLPQGTQRPSFDAAAEPPKVTAQQAFTAPTPEPEHEPEPVVAAPEPEPEPVPQYSAPPPYTPPPPASYGVPPPEPSVEPVIQSPAPYQPPADDVTASKSLSSIPSVASSSVFRASNNTGSPFRTGGGAGVYAPVLGASPSTKIPMENQPGASPAGPGGFNRAQSLAAGGNRASGPGLQTAGSMNPRSSFGSGTAGGLRGNLQQQQ